MRDAGEARHLALLGRPAPPARTIAERHASALDRGAIDVALEMARDAAEAGDDEHAARVLLGWLAGLEIDRALGPVADWIERWRSAARVVAGDGSAVAFDDVRRTIARQPGRDARAALERARTAVIERELLPTLVERDARWREVVAGFDLAASLAESVERTSGSALDALADRAREGLARSADAWRDTLSAALRRRGSIAPGAAAFHDLTFAFGTDEIDGAFRAPGRLDVARTVVREIGLGDALETRLSIDAGPAAEVHERAECVAVQPPGDVRVVIGSAGGMRAYDVALDETGRALHLAHTDGDAPFEARALGDPGTRAMCGRIMASLLLDRGWLSRQLALSRSEAATVARAIAGVALHDLRRACGATLYRTRWLAGDLAYGAAQELYVTTMTEAFGVAPPPVDALFEAPPTLVPGARMRGFEATGTLLDGLIERFDVDWYRNPRAGPWLAHSVFAAARGRLAADVVTRAVGRRPSLDRYIERLETELSS